MKGRPTKEQAREHERRAWELRQKGWTQTRIAAEMGLAQQVISKILRRLSDRYLKELSADVGRVKAEQTAQLLDQYDEARRAWERSKESAKSVTKRTGAGGASGEQITQHAEDQDGDVRYLAEARATLADIRGIWGADAPKRNELSGPDGGPLQITGVEFVRPAPAEPPVENGLKELPGGDSAVS